MTQERSDIKVPVWRKKVDSSIFEHKTTTIPNAFVKIWQLDMKFKDSGRKNNFLVMFHFKGNKKSFKGHIRKAINKRKSPAWLICFDDEVLALFQKYFSMTYF